MTATGWQQHSVRGFLAGVVRKKLGLNLVSEPTDKGRVYRIKDGKASSGAAGSREAGGLMRCGRSVAMVESRPRHLLRTRSRICAVSISKVCAHGGRACCKDRRPIICRGICCLRSSPIAFKPIASGISTMRHGSCLDRTDAKETGAAMSARLVKFDQKRTELTPGTVLVREWDRRSQRVMVMARWICLERPDL